MFGDSAGEEELVEEVAKPAADAITLGDFQSAQSPRAVPLQVTPPAERAKETEAVKVTSPRNVLSPRKVSEILTPRKELTAPPPVSPRKPEPVSPRKPAELPSPRKPAEQVKASEQVPVSPRKPVDVVSPRKIEPPSP